MKTDNLSLQMNNLEVDEQKKKKRRSGERGIPLLTTKAITLPPGRLDYVQCHVDLVDTNLEGLTGVVESNTAFVRRSGICVGDSLSTVDGNKQVRVGLLNMGDTPYTVMKGSRVATIEVMTAKQAEYLKPIMPEIAEKLHQADEKVKVSIEEFNVLTHCPGAPEPMPQRDYKSGKDDLWFPTP